MAQQVIARVERVVDGDTVRVSIEDRSISVRIQCLDTEESQATGGKPVTPWGIEATRYATDILPAGSAVTVTLESVAPLFDEKGSVAVDHLDNFNRLLGLLDLDAPRDDGGAPTTDFQELMIRQGYSPYFVKYGRTKDPARDHAYAAAERNAQADDLGLWNQLAVNGSVARDYNSLAVWWELRAQLIDRFRAARAEAAEGELLNSRLDYARLLVGAAAGERARVFLELRSLRPIGRHALIETGSLAQPFALFVPDADGLDRQPLRRLLSNRYLGDSEARPARNYAYVTGPLQIFSNRPQLVLTGVDQISDA